MQYITRRRAEIIPGLLLVVLIALSAFLLKGDFFSFFSWWLLALILGAVWMPVTGRLFSGFADKGWVFSKILAIAVSGYLVFALTAARLIRFTLVSCIIVTALLGAGCVFLLFRDTRREIQVFPLDRLGLILTEEVLFVAFFLLWTYVAGFHPEAYGTEKFMDYGFMEAMMRSDYLPATDMWYSGSGINYYYGGQYFAVFLTKLTASRVEISYNLMRTFVAALAFIMPFSLVRQMSEDLATDKRKRLVPVLAGAVSGAAVSIAGNMHYVIYAWILPFIQRLRGEEETFYWFPDATRYIGHNPDNPLDKTIHEFPCYSFVLGDLHAHVVNIMFVLLLVGILYACLYKSLKDPRPEETGRAFWIRELLSPHILLVGLLLGIYKWTNYWDFVIYFVVAGGTVLFADIVRFRGKIGKVLLSTILKAAEFGAVSWLISLPFTLTFIPMVSEVKLAQNHSAFYQLLVLWGLPAFVVIVFLVSAIMDSRAKKEGHGLSGLLEGMHIPDLFAVVTGLCALGLVLIPELCYVKDIYEAGNARANTMFKLTYQAYILFGITMGYAVFRLLMVSRQLFFKCFSAAALVLWIWTLGYFGNAVSGWFGNLADPSFRQGLYALSFLDTDFPEDAGAIQWLKENVPDVKVVLEANGDSYTGYERVSATTGLPTVLGWYVHEWLWRNDTDSLNQRNADVDMIYTSQDTNAVRELIEKYGIDYIFVGSMEREKFGERLNTEGLRSQGSLVYGNAAEGSFILKV